MKNKIFELYKPDSLREFLDFYKNNPEEKFVYVAQQPPANINILSASDFGYLSYLFTKHRTRVTSNLFYFSIREKNEKKFTKYKTTRLFVSNRRSYYNWDLQYCYK